MGSYSLSYIFRIKIYLKFIEITLNLGNHIFSFPFTFLPFACSFTSLPCSCNRNTDGRSYELTDV